MTDNINIYEKLPIITLRGMVVYPGNKMHFDISRISSVLALQESIKTEPQKIFLVAQTNMADEKPSKSEIYSVGAVAKISQILKNNDGSIRTLVEIEERAKIIQLYDDKKYLEADVQVFSVGKIRNKTYCKALVKTAKNLFRTYYSLIKKIPEEIIFKILDSEDPVFISEYIASNLSIDIKAKQEILEAIYPEDKLKILIKTLDDENSLLNLEIEILNKLQDKIDQNQKEYYLREQMKIISEELHEEANDEDGENYKIKIENTKFNNNDVKEKLLKEVEKLSKLPPSSQEASVIESYLDICLDLPWNKNTKDKINIQKSRQILDKDHYGLTKVKERILELLSVKKLNPDIDGQILCLCGPPGIGKTSIAKSIAKTMGRSYARISLGGIKDESDIRGHRKTYIGAMPGRIINAIKTAKTKNPLILLDELDKMSNDFRGDPASAMLEVLDAEQNVAFVDHYLEIPFDLSNVLFLATANDKNSIPSPLLDRMEIIDLPSYTRNEKYNIAKKHLVPKQLKKHGLTSKDLKISDSALFEIIDYYTSEAGVRNLERNIAKLCRKIVKNNIIQEENSEQINKLIISNKNTNNYLGPRKFKPESILDKNEIGVATGLAWTNVGGEIMHIEVSILDGNGHIELTGCLGDIMKESAKAAISYIRSKANDFGIDESFYKNKDIHIHVPVGAVPKDGPSAGVTICTALVSELTKIPVNRTIAMTGEITLRGRVLPIGGLKEKTMAAYRTGIKTVFIPKDNESDLYDIDPIVKESINFISSEHIESILAHALIYPLKKTVKTSSIGFVQT